MPIAPINDLGQFGLILDQQPHVLPPNAFSGARNMRFRDGYAERVRGHAAIFTTPTITPYFVTPYTTSTARFWAYAGTQRVFVDDGATRTDITPAGVFTGAQDDRWTGGSLNGVLVLNNGVDQPQFWGGNTANDLANLTGWNANWRAKFVRPFKNYLIAGYVTKSGTAYPHMVKWSHAADPGTVPTSWNEADPTVDAGEQDLAETPDVLVDCLPMGDLNIVYKERSMYAMQFIGQPFIWRFQRLKGDVGMLARGCAVQTPAGHVVLAAGDVILHNGGEPKSILTGKLRSWLQTNMDSTYYARSFVTANPKRSEVWICFPEAGQTLPSKAIIWNWESDTLGIRDIDNTTYGAFGQINYSAASSWDADADSWDSDSSSWDADEYSPAEARLILSRSTPDFVLVDTGSTFSGTNPTAYLERSGLTLGDPDTVKTIKSIRMDVEAQTGTVLTIEAGGTMSDEVAPSYTASTTYTVGSTTKADLFATGKFLALKISSSGAQPWRIKALRIEFQPRGLY